jgi:hypothetical protein
LEGKGHTPLYLEIVLTFTNQFLLTMGNRQELSLDLLRLPVNFGSQLCACVLGMDMEFGIIWRIIC